MPPSPDVGTLIFFHLYMVGAIVDQSKEQTKKIVLNRWDEQTQESQNMTYQAIDNFHQHYQYMGCTLLNLQLE